MQLNRPLATVTPTLDGDVLSVLAAADMPFTVPQIQRMLTTPSAEGIRKVLTRLTAQGVVLHDRAGRTNTYRLNVEHLAAEPVMALARLTGTFLDRLEAYLAAWGEELIYAAVFGSAATGQMAIDSDIDVFLVRASEPANPPVNRGWEQRVADLACRVTAWTGNDARTVEYTEVELHAAAMAGEPLLRQVAAQGLTVAGKRAWLSSQLRSAGSTATKAV